MSISSYPFDGQAVSEGQYSYLFRELASHSGVADTRGGAGFNVFGDNSGMKVKVNPGFAIIRGHAIQSTATEVVTIAAASAAQRYDRVVLRLDPTANSITIAVVQGSSGGGVPALTQTDTGLYEFPLATVSVPVGAATVTSGNVTGEREFLGNTVGGWTTATRPKSPRIGRLGLNGSTNSWEFWDGTTWKDLAPTVTWSSVQGAPATFPPAPHTHLWADLTDRPATFPSSAHTHPWADVTGKPTTFPPATHAHTWSSITAKPTTFPPAGHTHNYLEASDTIAWANGTKRVHADSVSGSGTYYAVWVQGDGTFARNTSSIKYKENVRDFEVNPDGVLALRPVIYDRKDTVNGDGSTRLGRKNEVGLIAEEAEAAGLDWLVNYLDGEVDGLRYDLLGVALVPVVQRQARQIADLDERLAALEGNQP